MPIDPRRILFCDEHLLVVNKLSGELVVRGKGKVEKLPLLDFLKKDYPGLRAIHRLDYQTSGCIVFARSKKVLEAVLKSDFAGWKKKYLALVVGRPKRQGVIRIKLPARGKGIVEAITRYHIVESFRDVSLVECDIETGRHHQIRRHFAEIGHPLVLDDEYGHVKFNRLFARAYGCRKLFLHAVSLAFPHPVQSQVVHVEAPLPPAFDRAIQRLHATS